MILARGPVPFVDQGGMALPALDYYLKDDAHYQDLRTKYVAHVQKMLEIIGEPSDKAAADAKTVLEIETAFAS